MIRVLAVLALSLVAASPARAEVDVQEVTSPGGITAWLVEEHSIPFVALEIRFRGGASLDDPETRGATNLMMGLLEEGTGDLDAQGFAAARDALAASYGFEAGDDAVSVSARFLSENRDEAVDLLRRALVEPNFDQTAIDRVRQQVLSIIARNNEDPGAIAGDAWDAATYPDHPYGSPVTGTAETVSGLTRDDIVEAHGDALALDRVYVSAVGDITPEELRGLLDDLLGGFPQESGAELPADAGWQIDPGISVIDYDVPQSVILFGQPGLDRDDPDFLTAYVVNEILGGGGFNSRLMEEVRVKRGLTYGIGTYLVPMDYSASVIGQASTANATAAEAIDVIRSEWQRIAEDGVTEDELDEVKTFLTGAFPLRFDGNARIAGILVGMQMDGLPLDYVATRNDDVEAITLEDANRVASELYDPANLSFMVIGQPEGLSEGG